MEGGVCLELDVPEVSRMSGPQDTFTTGEVRVQAARILASDVMRRAEKLRDLLQYFVEERIAHGDRPASQKQIATIVLGATADFNPTSSAHVRIYVRRLRKLLAKYYAGPGASDPLILGVTAGAYRLSVEHRTAAGQSDAPAVKSGRRSARARSIVLLTEFKAKRLDDELRFLANVVPRHLVLHLLGEDGIVAIGPIPWTARTARDACESPGVLKTAADFLLEGELKSGQPGGNGQRTIEITIRLHDIETGDHLWSQNCTERFSPGNLEALPEMIAARLVAIMPKSMR